MSPASQCFLAPKCYKGMDYEEGKKNQRNYLTWKAVDPDVESEYFDI